MQQIRQLQKTGHENVLQVMDEFSTSSKIYIVFEYFNGVDILQDVSNREVYSEVQAASVITRVLEATALMH